LIVSRIIAKYRNLLHRGNMIYKAWNYLLICGIMKIPIILQYKGKPQLFHFENVLGAGKVYHFHLMHDGYYIGQLFYTEKFFWQYGGNEFEGMGDFFGDYVTAWLDANA